MEMRIHFFSQGLPDVVRFGSDREGMDWRWRGDVLIVRHHNGDRREYPGHNIKFIEINPRGGASWPGM